MSNLKMQEIERQIQEEFTTFNNSIYSGKLPKQFIEKFKKAAMVVPQKVHQMSTKKIKEIAAKKEGKLTNLDFAYAANLISSVSWDKMYSSFDEAVKENQFIEDLKLDYNISVKNKEAELDDKKARMISLAGINVAKKPLALV